jgi:hypothetical protein
MAVANTSLLQYSNIYYRKEFDDIDPNQFCIHNCGHVIKIYSRNLQDQQSNRETYTLHHRESSKHIETV